VEGNVAWFGVASYALAGVAYAAVTIMLLLSNPGSRPATWLTAAAGVSSAWGIAVAVLLLTGYVPFVALVGLDALHLLVWIGCVLSWLTLTGGPTRWTPRGLYAATAGALGASALAGAALGSESTLGGTVFPSLLGASLIGLLVVEQVFRNARDDERRSLRFLSIALGGIFVVDVVVYAQATLLDGLTPFLWESKGIVNAALTPFLLLAAKRRQEWERALFVSRQVTFYTASLVAVGIYLLAMGIIAYVIRSLGGEWGPLLQIAFLLLAAVVLVPVLFSASIRARFKVFLVKHFYRHKYDYREEWLRLTASLGRGGDLRQLVSSALHGIARIVASERGSLWLTRDGLRYERMDSLDAAEVGSTLYDIPDPLVAFLAEKGWVVDSDEYAAQPDLYGSAFGVSGEGCLPASSITVPLDCHGTLLGFVILVRSPSAGPLNFEDHDILKTAGKQVAVVLAQALAQERLAETRQFEAVNKLATFLMHDLKNLIDQQELVVANAQRFKHRPEFIDDAFTTIRSSVERMKRLLDQLRTGAREGPKPGRVDVSKVVMAVRSQCADRKPIPKIELDGKAAWVSMDRDQLKSVLTHLVRNAQDATSPEGNVTIGVTNGGGELLITVSDTGCGMDSTFLKERLFRPFDSTKGARGMGVGAYQVRYLVRLAGGDVNVTSDIGKGTTFQLRIPIAPAR